MKNDIYQKLIEHVTRRQWVDATEVFRSVLEQKIALRLESEKKLLQEPGENEQELDERIATGLPTPNVNLQRKPTGKPKLAGERASAGRC
jgi:hypothetical protein